MSKKNLSKIFELRASLLNWEKRVGIDEFSDHKKIILSLLSQIKKFPNKIYNFLIYLKDNNASEKIIFETMQAYLRYLTKDKTLR